MSLVKISSKYQITLPKAICEALKLGPGDRLIIALEGDKIVLRPLPRIKSPTEVLYGSVRSHRDAVEAVRAFREAASRV